MERPIKLIQTKGQFSLGLITKIRHIIARFSERLLQIQAKWGKGGSPCTLNGKTILKTGPY